MTQIHRIFRFFIAAMLLAGFALPSGAANTNTKYFYAQFPTVAPSANPQKVSVTFFNATPPPGVSTINSIKIDLVGAPAGLIITAVKMTAPTVATPSWQPASGTSITITNFPGVKNNKSGTFELTLSGVPATCTNINWAAYANTGNAYPAGDEFQPTRTDLLSTGIGCDGVLKCPSLSSGFTFGESDISGYRGENKDGTACIPVVYDVLDNRTSSNPSVKLSWDTNLQPGASFEYTIPWLEEFVDPVTGLSARKTKVSWFVNGSLIPEVTGRACLSDSLPLAYGTLFQNITTTPAKGTQEVIKVTATTTADVSSALPPPPPFAISIDSERMLVKGISGNNWTVVRGDGDTAPAQHPVTRTNGSTTKVSGNPLPLDQNFKQMQVCIKKETWEAVDADYCPAPGDTTKLCGIVKYTTTLFDIGDGLIIRAP